MGDGIGGPVVRCISGNVFELDVTHYRKDNQEQYSKLEKILIAKNALIVDSMQKLNESALRCLIVTDNKRKLFLVLNLWNSALKTI